jgi:hypothetical protein
LSGVVLGSTLGGRRPIAGARLAFSRDDPRDDGFVTDAYTATDSQGHYEFCRLPLPAADGDPRRIAAYVSVGSTARVVEFAFRGDTVLDIDMDFFEN